MTSSQPNLFESKQYDVIVVGAGPAGSSAGLELVKAGISTLIVDKASFPREKLCGNLISGFCLNRLEGNEVESLSRAPVCGAIVRYGNHQMRLELDKPMAQYIERRIFDHFLLQRAVSSGAVFKASTRVKRVRKDRSWYLLETDSGYEIRSKYVIGADGATGVVCQYVRGSRYKRFEQGLAFATEIPVSYLKPEIQEIRNLAFLDLESIRGGYAWIFIEGDVANIGVGSMIIFARNLRNQFISYVHKAVTNPDFEFTVRAHPLPVGGIPRQICRDNVFLVGDAAGVIDAISGEGVGFSVLSGQLAAKSIIDELRVGGRARRIYVNHFRKYILSQLSPLLLYAGLLLFLRPLFFSLKPEESIVLFRMQFDAVAGRSSHKAFVFRALLYFPFLFVRSLCRSVKSFLSDIFFRTRGDTDR